MKKEIVISEKSFFHDFDFLPAEVKRAKLKFGDLADKHFGCAVLLYLVEVRPEYETDIDFCVHAVDKFLHDYREFKKNA